jgi:pimeloyl-ACP methyl ester carboxylesterase
MMLNPAPGSLRYRRYRAESVERARLHAQDDARFMLVDGWVPHAEYWDESASTLVWAYTQASRSQPFQAPGAWTAVPPPPATAQPRPMQAWAARPYSPQPDAAQAGVPQPGPRRGNRSSNVVVGFVVLLAIVVAIGSSMRLADPLPPTQLPDPTNLAAQPSIPAFTPDPSATSGPNAAGPVPRFERTACRSPMVSRDWAECGDLIVLEDRSNPDGPRISLHAAIVRSLSDAPRPDPVVYLEGGPGGSALSDGFVEYQFTGERDLIVFDQRGVGFSEPSLACGEHVILMFFQDQVALRSCRRRLARSGVDPANYNTTASAADVEDLRVALGYEQWNLYGISYGTRLALEVMRRHPAGVRSVILDSVYPMGADVYTDGALNAQRAFDTLLAGCAEQEECRAAYPDLESHLYELVERLNGAPYQAATLFGLGGLAVDGGMFIRLLFARMYSTYNLPGLPASIESLWQGDLTELDLWVDELMILRGSSEPAGPWSLSIGAHYSVQCAESLPIVDDSRLGTVDPGVEPAVAAAFDWQYLIDDCTSWDVPPVPAEFHHAVESSLPTLLLAGTYDPITPPAWAESAAETLPNGQLLIVRGMGHGVVGSGEWCIDGVVDRFLARPTEPLRAGCVDDIGPLEHILPFSR